MHSTVELLKRVSQLSNRIRKAEKTGRENREEKGLKLSTVSLALSRELRGRQEPWEQGEWKDFRPGTGSRGAETDEGGKPRHE